VKRSITIKKGLALWAEAKKIIPGGTQLLSKRSELFLPEQWPSYFARAKGVSIWDLDGNKFTDMTIMGVGTCILGYADRDVNAAVKKVIAAGSMSTLNSPEEVELAGLLLDLDPWAGGVRFARTGGEAMAMAVRIARAHTKKDTIAFCGYHGWQDWYLSANLGDSTNLDGQLLPGLDPLGVPRALKGTALPFHYNKIDELRAIFANCQDVAAVVMEPIRHNYPENDFLSKVQELANQNKAVLIFDEITSGFRMRVGGVYPLFKTQPDMVVYAKGMSNGYPMASVIGRGEIMEATQRSFISSTYWTERVGPVAALATIRKMRAKKVPEHLCRLGELIGKGWQHAAARTGLQIKVQGLPPLATLVFSYMMNSQELATLFTQEMLKRGYLASRSVYVSYSHSKKCITQYLEQVEEVFAIMQNALVNNKVQESLQGPVAHSGFQRLT